MRTNPAHVGGLRENTDNVSVYYTSCVRSITHQLVYLAFLLRIAKLTKMKTFTPTIVTGSLARPSPVKLRLVDTRKTSKNPPMTSLASCHNLEPLPHDQEDDGEASRTK